MVGLNAKLDTPLSNQAEVTLIGGTSGYGESVVIRYSANDWAIIDSCFDTATKKCLPLDYLREIGVNIEQQVKYVFCTHWHDDHIKGLHTILKACSKETVFCVAIASDRLNFLYEIERSNLFDPDRGARRELILAMEVASSKGMKVKRLLQDLVVFKSDNCECYALSPSQKEIESFFEELASAMSIKKTIGVQKDKLSTISEKVIESAEDISSRAFASLQEDFDITGDQIEQEVQLSEKVFKNNIRAQKGHLNDRSAALLFSIQGHHIVLGADLEISSDSDCGWQSVNDCICMKGIHASVFKIPHHGSHTGYCDFFIQNHIKSSATGKISTWFKGDKRLPEKNMVEKYFHHLPKLYITADPSLLICKFSSPDYRSIMEETTESIVDIKNRIGIIRSRIDLTNGIDEWETKVFGTAILVTKEKLNLTISS